MDIELQLLSFLFSFLYGILVLISSSFHFKKVRVSSFFWKYFLTTIYIIDIVLLYFIILYYINHGILHVYFLIFLAMGWLAGYVFKKYVKFKYFLKKE